VAILSRAGRRPAASVFTSARKNCSLKKLRRLIAVLALCSAAGIAEAQSPTEYQVKAAFLYNFAKFVEWPARSFPAAGTPLTFCVVGEDPFGSDLEEITRGKTIDQRKLATRRVKKGRERECHILFVSPSEEARLGEILRDVKDASVLTVSDIAKFSRTGGIIGFIIEGNKIRFEINLDAAERAGLKISSRLLKLAKIVRDGGQ
jgi:hypothetical protein